MAKAILLCFKNISKPHDYNLDFEKISQRIIPNNIIAKVPLVIKSANVILSIFNNSPAVEIKNSSLCLGKMIGADSHWYKIGTEIPDGTIALFRNDDDFVELATDLISSRSIWYYHDENIFIASNSQTAIIAIIGSFQFNEAVIPWVLSSGTLGLGLSWDKRIHYLPSDSTLLFDKKKWKVEVETRNSEFTPVQRSYAEHYDLLKNAIQQTFDEINYNNSHWILPLSGGFDSRAILLFLREKQNLKCITWGLKDSLKDKNDDPYIALKLAEHFKLKHQFYQIEESSENIKEVLNRFLVANEGRIDHIAAYMDGFRVWKELYESNYHGIIRGDEGFGWGFVTNEKDVRRRIGLDLLDDFENHKLLKEFNIIPQNIPEEFYQHENETLEKYRDRIYYKFRIPFVLGALNEIKSSFVEISNPFLSRNILNAVRTLPDDLRTNKKLFRNIINDMSPNIAYSKYSLIGSVENILKREDIVKCIKDDLSSYSNRIFPSKFYEWLLANMEISNKSPSRNLELMKGFIKTMLPNKFKSAIKSNLPRTLDKNVLAFRVYTVEWICRNLKN